MAIETWQFVTGLVGVLVTYGAAIAWLVRLQGRQQGHEDVCQERYRQIAANFASLAVSSDMRHAENSRRLERIDEKMDRLLEAG